MFKKFSGLAMALGAFSISAPATAQDEVLTVVNRTGYTISEIYISPSDTNRWEEDLLGWNTLPSGNPWRIDFSQSANTCWWDIKIVYEIDGVQEGWGGLNFCALSRIEVYYNESTGETSIRTI